jgi:hypothetical protein
MKKGVIIISLSLILVLSLSLVSAGFLDDLFRNIFGGFPVPGFPTSTGKVIGGTGATCTDTDGMNNYLTGGSVTENGVTYNDYCVGNTNYDFYCAAPSDTSGTNPLISFLPLTPSITGASVGNPTDPNAPPSTSTDCQANYQVPCNVNRCGCTTGSTKLCYTGTGSATQQGIGQCVYGAATCSNGLYGSCIGSGSPSTEVCDGIDNDCDNSTDEGLTGCSSSTINPPANSELLINPDDIGSGATPCTGTETKTCGYGGLCTNGTYSCVNGYWSACTGEQTRVDETCNGLDDDCDGVIDNADWGSLCQTGYSCDSVSKRCVPSGAPCTDTDNDGYGNPGSSTCASSSSLTDCNDNNKNVTPVSSNTWCDCNTGNSGGTSNGFETEICDNFDNDCDGQINEGGVCPTCTDTDGDKYSTESNPSSCGNSCSGTTPCAGGNDCAPNDITKWRTSSFYKNSDGDSQPESTLTNNICYGSTTPTGYSTTPGTDCNDLNPGLWQLLTGYPDADGDGLYSSTSQNICSGSALPSGYRSTQGDDCNDGNRSIGGKTTFYTDGDNDGYGDASKPTTQLCEATGGWSSRTGDCDDNSNTAYPGAQELCADNIDNNCVGGINENCDTPKDYYCDGDNDGEFSLTKNGTALPSNIPVSCTEVQGKDCDDTKPNINTRANETCDGVDENCKNGPDDGLLETLTCLDELGAKGGIRVDKQCVGGVYKYKTRPAIITTVQSDCVKAGYKDCKTEEILANQIDDNCNGGVDEGSECTTEGETNECNPRTGNPCDIGQQTCTGGILSSCEVIDQTENCNSECVVGTPDVCSTQMGICSIGVKWCGSNGMWGATCDGGVLPKTEVCSDTLDNDCDGTEDEADCVSNVDANAIDALNDYESSLSDTILGDTTISLEDDPTRSSGAGSSSKEGEESGFWAFVKKLLGLLGMIFKVGHVLGQPILEDVSAQSYCTDSDVGKNYFLIGNGEGLNQQETQLWFEDFCYEGDLNNKQDKCAGSDCFLNEYYCNGKFIASEPAATCPYGCVNGACIPDASLSDNCKHFNNDPDNWGWVNIC